jgi:hypothetical protein
MVGEVWVGVRGDGGCGVMVGGWGVERQSDAVSVICKRCGVLVGEGGGDSDAVGVFCKRRGRQKVTKSASL